MHTYICLCSYHVTIIVMPIHHTYFICFYSRFMMFCFDVYVPSVSFCRLICIFHSPPISWICSFSFRLSVSIYFIYHTSPFILYLFYTYTLYYTSSLILTNSLSSFTLTSSFTTLILTSSFTLTLLLLVR